MNSNSASGWLRTILPWWSAGLLSLLAANLLVVFMLPPNFPDFGEDSGEYRDMALNRWDNAHQPFSARFLHPKVVAIIAHKMGWSVDSAFVVGDVVALPLTLLGLAVVLTRMALPAYLLVPITFSAAFVRTVRLAYMPDLFYTLLLSLFFIALIYRLFMLAALMLIVLFCARESTIILGIIAAACALWSKDLHTLDLHTLSRVVPMPGTDSAPLTDRKPRYSLFLATAFGLATVTGFIINRHEAGKVPNVHHISGLTYFAGKAPYNFAKNILGIEIWSNTLAHSLGNHPWHQFALPKWLKLGAINAMGINDASVSYPARWLLAILCTFGVLLTVVVQSVWTAYCSMSSRVNGKFHRLHRLALAFFHLLIDAPFAVQVAGIYGVLSMIISPLLGTATQRYVYYAWPAFWILGPWLLLDRYKLAADRIFSATVISLLLVHFALQWLQVVPIPIANTEWSTVALLLAAVVLQCFAWTQLRSIRLPGGELRVQ